jgi:hypothetical protein
MTKRRRKRRVRDNGVNRPQLINPVQKKGWQSPWLVMDDLKHDDVIEIPCHTMPGFASKLMVKFPVPYIKACMADLQGCIVHDSNLIDDLVWEYRLYMARNKGRRPEAVELVYEPLYYFRPAFGSTWRASGGAPPGLQIPDGIDGISRVVGDTMVHPGPVRIVTWFAVNKIVALRPGR